MSSGEADGVLHEPESLGEAATESAGELIRAEYLQEIS